TPGQFRLTRTGGGTVLNSPTNSLSVATKYRVELQYDTAGTRGRAAIFEMNSNLPLWDSGWQTDAVLWTPSIARVEIGRPNNSPNTFPFHIDSILMTDSVTEWTGRHATDIGGAGPPPDPNYPREWTGGDLPVVVGNVTVDASWGLPTQPSLKIAQAAAAT